MGEESTAGEVAVVSLPKLAKLFPSNVVSRFWLLSSKSLRVVVADADLLLFAVDAMTLLLPLLLLLLLFPDFSPSDFRLSLRTSA